MTHETWRTYPPSVLADLIQRPSDLPPQCSIDGCPRRLVARGWCQRHYYRWLKLGDPMAPYEGNGNRITDATIERVKAIYPSVKWSAFDWIDEVFDSPWRLNRLAAAFGRALANHPMTPEHEQSCQKCRRNA